MERYNDLIKHEAKKLSVKYRMNKLTEMECEDFVRGVLRQALIIDGVSKRFSIEQAQELFFAGYFHYPMKELDKKETEVGGLNKEFLKVVERDNY